MRVRDQNIEWLRKHVFRSASQMTHSHIMVPSASLASMYEVGTSRLPGFEFDVAGQFCFDSFALPFDMDPDFDLKFRLHYTGVSTTAADTYTWKGFYNNALSAGAAADPATAFGVDFGAANVLSGTAYQIGRTGWGSIPGKTWTRAQVEAGHIIGVEFELDASDATLATEQAYLVGYEFSFVRQETRGEGSASDYDSAS